MPVGRRGGLPSCPTSQAREDPSQALRASSPPHRGEPSCRVGALTSNAALSPLPRPREGERCPKGGEGAPRLPHWTIQRRPLSGASRQLIPRACLGPSSLKTAHCAVFRAFAARHRGEPSCRVGVLTSNPALSPLPRPREGGCSARKTVQWTVFSEAGPVRARWDPMRQHWARAFGRPLGEVPEGRRGGYPIPQVFVMSPAVYSSRSHSPSAAAMTWSMS